MIAGYAAVFNSDSFDMGFIEQVDPMAFNKTLADRVDVRALVNHDPNQILGRVKNGTLQLSTDATGLRYAINVNQEDQAALGTAAQVRRGDLDGSSFGFQTIRDEWNWETSPPQRRLLEVALVDVGPVCFPAYEAATSEARSILQDASARSARARARISLAAAELSLMRMRTELARG